MSQGDRVGLLQVAAERGDNGGVQGHGNDGDGPGADDIFEGPAAVVVNGRGAPPAPARGDALDSWLRRQFHIYMMCRLAAARELISLGDQSQTIRKRWECGRAMAIAGMVSSAGFVALVFLASLYSGEARLIVSDVNVILFCLGSFVYSMVALSLCISVGDCQKRKNIKAARETKEAELKAVRSLRCHVETVEAARYVRDHADAMREAAAAAKLKVMVSWIEGIVEAPDAVAAVDGALLQEGEDGEARASAAVTAVRLVEEEGDVVDDADGMRRYASFLECCEDISVGYRTWWRIAEDLEGRHARLGYWH